MKNTHFHALVLLIVFALPSHGFAQEEIFLWEQGAPGFEDRKDEPQKAKDWWVKNIHNPSITVFLPPEALNTGAAVIICPGGGHRELVFDEEGTKTAKFFNELGVAAFVLKYRLSKEADSPYSVDIHPEQDMKRAMRLVRSRATSWNIDKNKIGAMGFSAGAEVVAKVAYTSTQGEVSPRDAIDKLSAKPNFQILIYPGPAGIPDTIPADTPPAFVLVANDDPCCSEPALKLLQGYRAAKLPIEAHFFAKGGHGFNMGDRSDLKTLKTWPTRLKYWIEDSGLLVKK